MLKVWRAHAYEHVELINAHLSRLPAHWTGAIRDIPWVILPIGLSPLWIGLLKYEVKALAGRLLSETGGWYSDGLDTYPYFSLSRHIYLTPIDAWAAVHEAAHALEQVWHTPIHDFYNPNAALYPYMALNAEEYFACGLDAFLWPEQDDVNYNRADLAELNPALFAYLSQKLDDDGIENGKGS